MYGQLKKLHPSWPYILQILAQFLMNQTKYALSGPVDTLPPNIRWIKKNTKGAEQKIVDPTVAAFKPFQIFL